MHLLPDMIWIKSFPNMMQRKHHLHLSFLMLKILLGLCNRADHRLSLVIFCSGNNIRNKLNKVCNKNVFLIFRNITNLCKTGYIHLYRFRFESISPVKKKKSERLAHSSHYVCLDGLRWQNIVSLISKNLKLNFVQSPTYSENPAEVVMNWLFYNWIMYLFMEQ